MKKKHKVDEYEYLNPTYCTGKCACGYTINIKHEYSDWTYNKKTDLDECTCKYCGHKKAKKHSNTNTNTGGGGSSGGGGGGGSSSGSSTSVHEHRYTYTYLDNVWELGTCAADGATTKRKHDTSGTWTWSDVYNDFILTCPTCNHVITQGHNHDFENYVYFDNDFEIGTCSIDGKTNKRAHTVPSWSYDAILNDFVGMCSTCGHAILKGHIHEFEDYEYFDNDYEQGTCHTDGATNKRPHTVISWSHNTTLDKDQGYCTTCGHLIYKAHDYVVTYDDDATHLETWTCSDCDHTFTQAHDLRNDWSITNDGLNEERHCHNDGCGFTETRERNLHTHVSATGLFELRENPQSTDSICGVTYDLGCIYDNCPDHLNETRLNETEVGHDLKTNYTYVRTYGGQVYLKKYDSCNRDGCNYKSAATTIHIPEEDYVPGSEYLPFTTTSSSRTSKLINVLKNLKYNLTSIEQQETSKVYTKK